VKGCRLTVHCHVIDWYRQVLPTQPFISGYKRPFIPRQCFRRLTPITNFSKPEFRKREYFHPISHLFLGARNKILRRFIFGAYLERNVYEMSAWELLGVYDSHGMFHVSWDVTLRRLVNRRKIIVKCITILRYLGTYLPIDTA
jgi:hypothetical protein